MKDITLVNIYGPNIGAPKYIKKISEDFKKEIDSNTVIIADFNTPLSTMNRSSKRKINKNIPALNDTISSSFKIYTEHFISKKQNIHSSQMHMEHSQ